jgi:hypothetical protein
VKDVARVERTASSTGKGMDVVEFDPSALPSRKAEADAPPPEPKRKVTLAQLAADFAGLHAKVAGADAAWAATVAAHAAQLRKLEVEHERAAMRDAEALRKAEKKLYRAIASKHLERVWYDGKMFELVVDGDEELDASPCPDAATLDTEV